MLLDRGACFNVPGVFSPQTLAIRYPADDEVGCEGGPVEVGQKRKAREAAWVVEEVALNAIIIGAESEVRPTFSARGQSTSSDSWFLTGGAWTLSSEGLILHFGNTCCMQGLPPDRVQASSKTGTVNFTYKSFWLRSTGLCWEV
jgi:hypothetical protein